ncbi:MAG TPA: hypothetical protein VL970_11795 [Candidatus Acidoferrales bacterium]|nr:hypothetical protein [Candidatus Acidoferrales bacterium]
MKTALKVAAILMLILVVGCLIAGLCFVGLAGAAVHSSSGLDGVSHPLGAAFGLFVAAVAVVFALAVAALAMAGAFLAVLFALLLTGLILLAVALPFLLPLILPLVVILAVLFVVRRSSRSPAV